MSERQLKVEAIDLGQWRIISWGGGWGRGAKRSMGWTCVKKGLA